MPSPLRKVEDLPVYTPPSQPNKTLRTVVATLALLLLASGGSAYYFWRELTELKRNPQEIAQGEVTALIARIGQLIVLPEGEAPTIATVTDPERLKDQAFFEKAKTGDKVLIYTNAKRAILYDPVSNKIVEVAPVNIGTPQTQTVPAAAPTEQTGE